MLGLNDNVKIFKAWLKEDEETELYMLIMTLRAAPRERKGGESSDVIMLETDHNYSLATCDLK